MIARFIIFIITGLRPLLGPAECRFEVSCTNYAKDELKNKPLLKALFSIIKRLLSCNPFF